MATDESHTRIWRTCAPSTSLRKYDPESYNSYISLVQDRLIVRGKIFYFVLSRLSRTLAPPFSNFSFYSYFRCRFSMIQLYRISFSFAFLSSLLISNIFFFYSIFINLQILLCINWSYSSIHSSLHYNLSELIYYYFPATH